MDTLLHIGLTNAFVATVLALFAAAVTRLWRRPTVAHALWLLVLLKLLTPPLWPVAVPWPDDAPPPVTPAVDAEPVLPPLAIAPAPEPSAAAVAVVEEEPEPVPAPPPIRWQPVVLAVWLGGSALWWALAGLRLRCFRRLLTAARMAPEGVQEQARALAARLGLKRCPLVWLVPAPVSPMLLALGRSPRLLLPEALWKQLGGEQQDALLAHELAHLRRGDPWVRRLELIVLGLYWWHPVAWWARHELQEAEEQCCDAWVVWALPEAAAAYAAALVDTVAFLSRSRAALPVGASGAGRVPLLKRRLTMILRGNAPRTLSRAGFWLLLGLAVVLLPLAPGGARTEPPADKADPHRDAAASEPSKELVRRAKDGHTDHHLETHIMHSCLSCHAVTPPRPPRPAAPKTWRQAHDEVVKLLDDVKATKRRLAETEARLERALKVLQRTGPAQKSAPAGAAPENPDARAEALFDSQYKDLGRIQRGGIAEAQFLLTNRTNRALMIGDVRQSSAALSVQVSKNRLKHGETAFVRVKMDSRRFTGVKSATVYVELVNGGQPPRAAVVKLVVRAVSEGTPAPGTTASPAAPRALDEKARLEQLEKQLEQMRREMQKLRRELHPEKPIADPLLDIKPPAKPVDPLLRTGHSRLNAPKAWRVAEFYRRTGHPGAARFYEEIARRRANG